MSTTAHRNAAIEALANREYERAGDAYSRGGWATLAAPRDGHSPFDGSEKGWVGRGLQSLATAAVAYRVAGAPERATHRAVEGVALARDLDTAFDRPVQQACLAEFVADFRLVGGLDGVDGAYDDAERAYRECAADLDDPAYWTTTPLFEAAAGTLQQVARGTANGEIAVTWEALHGADPSRPGAFLGNRVSYKRQRFGEFLDRTLDSGYLAAPRGTTEYDNDQYHCPACESADVNWTGENVLCLRCSRPLADSRET